MSSAALFEARGLTRRFGALVAVSNVSVALFEGEIHAVIGTNGAGKSTLINLLSGEIPPSSGEIRFDGRDVTHWPQPKLAQAGLAPGWYSAELRATAIEPWMQAQLRAGELAARVTRALRFAPNGVVEQRWELPVGTLPKRAMPAFAGLPYAHAPRALDPPGGLPYRIYLANLHSQTNHSDGGGEVSTCSSSQGAQSGAYGPADAYAYAMSRGLDVLMTSEHNHYFDGSSGTNSSATPAAAIAFSSFSSSCSVFGQSRPLARL